jgi:hypothetical protein
LKTYRWLRVTKKSPCRVCGKPDFCTYAPEADLVLCMRVESDKPSRNSLGGWLHSTNIARPVYVAPVVKQPAPNVDFERDWQRWRKETDHFHLDGFAMSLGVSTESLESLGCAWTGRAWAFPMRDAENRITGMRLRTPDGKKFAVTGSKSNLFIPQTEAQKTLYVLEGESDTAAALTLDLYAVGRPSCMGCEGEVKRLIQLKRITRTIIVADNDAPGIRGAARLSAALPVKRCTLTLPTKDIRQFVLRGGTRPLLESLLGSLVWEA